MRVNLCIHIVSISNPSYSFEEFQFVLRLIRSKIIMRMRDIYDVTGVFLALSLALVPE